MRYWDLLLFIILAFSSCSRQKTSPISRLYHSFTLRYNTLYNAQRIFDDARKEQGQKNSDLYTLGSSLECIDSSSIVLFRPVLDKCEKAILSHSLRSRPKNWRRFPSQQIEYNPIVHRAWQLLAEAQYYSKHAQEALQTFQHIANLYNHTLSIKQYALLWQIRCLVLLGQQSDIERILQDLHNLPNIPDKAISRLRNLTLAELYISQGNYKQSIQALYTSLSMTRLSEGKARLYYAIALCYQTLGEAQKALWALKKAYNYSSNEKLRNHYQHLPHLSPSNISPDILHIHNKPGIKQQQDSTLSSPLYPIDWLQIYTDSSKDQEDNPKLSRPELNLRYRITLTHMSSSEILFLVSSFTFKRYTQESIYIHVEESEVGYLTLAFTGFRNIHIYNEYKQNLEQLLHSQTLIH